MSLFEVDVQPAKIFEGKVFTYLESAHIVYHWIFLVCVCLFQRMIFKPIHSIKTQNIICILHNDICLTSDYYRVYISARIWSLFLYFEEFKLAIVIHFLRFEYESIKRTHIMIIIIFLLVSLSFYWWLALFQFDKAKKCCTHKKN